MSVYKFCCDNFLRVLPATSSMYNCGLGVAAAVFSPASLTLSANPQVFVAVPLRPLNPPAASDSGRGYCRLDRGTSFSCSLVVPPERGVISEKVKAPAVSEQLAPGSTENTQTSLATELGPGCSVQAAANWRRSIL